MPRTTFQELLDAGVHFGHLKRKWHPNMARYIFDEKKGIHVIDLNKTIVKIDEASAAMKQIAKSGKKILFVATKKQAKDIVAEKVKECRMPYVTERWSGGMLTNFSTIRKSIKKMNTIDRMLQDGTASSMTKKEILTLTRERNKLEKILGGIANLNRTPSAVFVVDIVHEHLAIKEAHKLGLRTFGMVDTNSDPNQVHFPIPANDDASKSIELIVNYLAGAIKEGLEDRRKAKDTEEAAAE